MRELILIALMFPPLHTWFLGLCGPLFILVRLITSSKNHTNFYVTWVELQFLKGVPEQDVSKDNRVYQNAYDVTVFMLHSDDQMIIIVRVEAEGVLLEKDDINPRFPSRISREARGYYSYRKHMPYVFPPRRWEDLELPQSAKHLAMVFVLYVVVLSAIFISKMEGIRVGVWPMLVLLGTHSGCHCSCQKVHMHVPPARVGRLWGLNRFITRYGG